MKFLRRKHADVGQRRCSNAPGFFSLDFAVDRPNQVVDVWVDSAVWIKLVSDQTFGPVRQHPVALVLQGLDVLERVEVPPGSVELAGVSQAVEAQIASVAHGDREV
jgi:hypothetical protein